MKNRKFLSLGDILQALLMTVVVCFFVTVAEKDTKNTGTNDFTIKENAHRTISGEIKTIWEGSEKECTPPLHSNKTIMLFYL